MGNFPASAPVILTFPAACLRVRLGVSLVCLGGTVGSLLPRVSANRCCGRRDADEPADMKCACVCVCVFALDCLIVRSYVK